MDIIYCASETKAHIWKEMTSLMHMELLTCTNTTYEICMKILIPNV